MSRNAQLRRFLDYSTRPRPEAQRDSKGKYLPGSTGSRPRNPITHALRRMVDPEKIAAYLIEVATSDNYDGKLRLRACEMILDRVEGKPVATVAVQPPTLPQGNYSALSVDEKHQLRQLTLRAVAQIASGAGPDDPIDVTSPDGSVVRLEQGWGEPPASE